MRWQAELLHYTYARVGMRSQLTALVSATDEPLGGFTCETCSVSNYKGRLGRETYEPLNKPGGICEWVKKPGPADEAVLIVDPDSAFIRAVPDARPLRRGEAYADAHDYMRPELEYNRLVLERHCRREFRSCVQPVGIYVLIRRDDLAALGPRWLQKAMEIRSDKVCRAKMPHSGWISRCWGTRSRRRSAACGTTSAALRRRPARARCIARLFTTASPSMRAAGTGRKSRRSRFYGVNGNTSRGSIPRWGRRQRRKGASCCAGWRSWRRRSVRRRTDIPEHLPERKGEVACTALFSCFEPSRDSAPQFGRAQSGFIVFAVASELDAWRNRFRVCRGKRFRRNAEH